jgi:hypothetical protein
MRVARVVESLFCRQDAGSTLLHLEKTFGHPMQLDDWLAGVQHCCNVWIVAWLQAPP